LGGFLAIASIQMSQREGGGFTHPALGAQAAIGVDPGVLGHDAALLGQRHVLGEL
jgi:hypothetical protein